MKYTKITENEYISCVCESNTNSASVGNISEEEYNAILSVFRTAPQAPDGYQYRLRADNLEWELVKLPPVEEPDLTADEALDIILGGADE